jgi:signal transduction histidine kinase
VVVAGILLLGAVSWLALAGSGDPGWTGQTGLAAEVGLGLVGALPFVVRFLTEVVPRSLTTGAMLGAAAALYGGLHAAGELPGVAEFRLLVDAAAVVALTVVLGPGRTWVRETIDRVVLRRSRRRRAELQAFLQTLSPELGALECLRRAAREIVRAFGIRGAAMLVRDGEVVVHGRLEVAALARAWPRGAAAERLPPHAFGTPHFWDLPAALQEILDEAGIVGVVPIRSPRGLWGHLIATAGPLSAIYSDEDVQTAEAFAAQVAGVLDGAELLARAVEVERSLAHAEKLAAVGELSARVAHEIRNPVTAARSLAQELARGGADAEAARLILAELERVERQVAALLRFARREEFAFARVDVGELAQATLATLRPRLEAAGVAVTLDAPSGVVARADREKLRQVLVNVIENAIDALARSERDRRLAVTVAPANGAAGVRLADSGPGVPADVLPSIFEPFFSRKEGGTGLGLAIAKRTIEAHGGRITATSPPGEGLTVEIAVPLGDPAPGGTT